MQANTSSDGATATKPLLQEAAAGVSFHGEEDRNRGGGGWWRKVLVLDVEEAKNQVLFSLPMILTNVFYYAIPLVSVEFAGHLGHLELAGATLANSWATVTVFAFMGLWTGLICGLSMQTSTLLLITLFRNWNLYCRRINSFWVCNPSPSSYLVSIKHQTDQSKEHILCILCYFALHFVLCMVFESVGALKDFLGMRTCGGWRRFLFFLPLVFFLPYLLSVLELHENSTVEGLPKKTRTKSDHLVLGPAAGQGLPNRLQCRGVKALNKTHISTSSHASSVGDSISFVTVFTRPIFTHFKVFTVFQSRHNATNNLSNRHELIVKNSTIALKPYLAKNAGNKFNPYGTDIGAKTGNNRRINERYDIPIE
ncbi:hypothetical protein Q3G72_000814 [Acer saccharum]|nr:hypothetical protein Q3G72_000814 [Acer saccharum]